MESSYEKSEALVMQVLSTAAAMERAMDHALSFTRGITFSEYRLLRTLQEAEHGLTRVALASAVSASPSGVTRALKPLEKLGYVTTARNERDARQSLAVLTQGGRDLLSDAAGVLTDYFASLGVDSIPDKELTKFRSQLTQLTER